MQFQSNTQDNKSELELSRADTLEKSFGPTFSQTLLTREMSKDLKLTLDNLVDVLMRYFDNMDPMMCEDVLIVLGNTGCGKSTLLGAMVHGSDALEEKIQEEIVQTHRGMKKKTKKFIDYKDSSKDYKFKIGHS